MKVFDFLWAPVDLLLLINCDAERSRLETYNIQRDKFFRSEQNRAFGANVALTSEEVRANETIMNAKINEFNVAFNQHGLFIPSRNIFETLAEINKSTLFQYLSQMPKGAVLHVHDRALCSIDCIMKLTYENNCMVCKKKGKQEITKFMFSKKEEINERKMSCVQLSTQRINESELIDKSLRDLLTINPMDNFLDHKAVWKKFEKINSLVGSLLSYAPVWRQYFYNSLKEFLADGVQYFEFRSSLPILYDLNGTPYTRDDTVGICKETLDRFMQEHPNFIGFKLIYAPTRVVDNLISRDYKEIYSKIKMKYPDFVAGFDLWGREDMSLPLKDFTLELLNMQNGTDFLWHAGETNWFGTSIDENLIDAVQLNTKRIGNAFALIKHPLVMEHVKKNDIAVEVLPISNQVLGFVSDNRNNPCSHLFADNYSVVVSSDYPSFWNVKPLSHDFYMAFFGIASFRSDLRLLKKLAENSINYSSLSETQKAEALKKWKSEWEKYIATFN